MRRITQFLYNQRVAPYVFVLPFVLTFAIFFVYPVITTVRMSFQDILPGMVTNVGLKNYQRLLGDRIFRTAVSNSFRYMFWTVTILIPMPLALAYMINSKSMTAPGFLRRYCSCPSSPVWWWRYHLPPHVW